MATAAHHTTDSYTDEIEELFDYRVIEQPATTSGHHSMIIGYGNQPSLTIGASWSRETLRRVWGVLLIPASLMAR